MRRIATATRATDLHGAGRDGFTEGVPASGTPPTQLSAAWFNDVQEALAHVIENAGLALANDDTQLRKAIEVLAADERANVYYDDVAGLWHHIDPTEDAHRLQLTSRGLAYYVHAAPGVDTPFPDTAWERRSVLGTARTQEIARWGSDYEGRTAPADLGYAGVVEALLRAGTGDAGVLGGAGTGMRYYSLYGAHVWTTNARWDGETWHKDRAAGIATRLVLSEATLTLSFVAAGPASFDEVDWTTLFNLGSSATFGGGVTAGSLEVTTDPGGAPVANRIYPGNVPRAWGYFECNGAGGFTAHDEFGVSLAVVGTHVVGTLGRAMAGTKYAVVGNARGALLAPCLLVGVPLNETQFELHVWPRSGAELDLATDATVCVSFNVFGKV